MLHLIHSASIALTLVAHRAAGAFVYFSNSPRYFIGDEYLYSQVRKEQLIHSWLATKHFRGGKKRRMEGGEADTFMVYLRASLFNCSLARIYNLEKLDLL